MPQTILDDWTALDAEDIDSMENAPFTIINLIEEMCIQKDVPLKAIRLARDIMNSDVKTLTLDHNVNQCIKFMASHNVRHVPVVDDLLGGQRKPSFIGIVSQRDVLRLGTNNTKGNTKQEADRRALRQLLVQIVARKPKSVSLQTPVKEVIEIMTSNHIDMVPVLDNSDLAGVITTTDILKLFFRLDKLVHELLPEIKKDIAPADTNSDDSAKAEILSSWISQTVQGIMTEQVICLELQDSLDRAIEILQTKEIRHLIIIDQQENFLGLISDRDILQNLPFAGKRPPSPPKKFREHLFAIKPSANSYLPHLEEIMVRKSNVSNIIAGCSIMDAVNILYENKISCLPVLDEQEKVEGIVTIIDLMRALIDVYRPIEEVSLKPSGSASR